MSVLHIPCEYGILVLLHVTERIGALKASKCLLLLDADDTLWESALFFERTEHDFLTMMTSLGSPEDEVRRTIHRKDIERLAVTGYGAGPYIDTLRLIMLDYVSNPPSWAFAALDDIRKNLLGHPVILMPGVLETLQGFRKLSLRTIVYTMGEEDHQSDKFRRSGLATLVDDLRIVDRKSVNALRNIIEYADFKPQNCILVGNSPRSDVNPALSLGAVAVHIARDRTWAAELEEFSDPGRVITINRFHELKDIVKDFLDEDQKALH
jgi:putative hydrolase of the HAD superfamily